MRGKLTALPYNARGRDEYYKEGREANMKIQPLLRSDLTHLALQQGCLVKDLCIMCGWKISTMAFKGTGVCSELCRKDRDRDHGGRKATIEAPQGGPK